MFVQFEEQLSDETKKKNIQTDNIIFVTGSLFMFSIICSTNFHSPNKTPACAGVRLNKISRILGPNAVNPAIMAISHVTNSTRNRYVQLVNKY